MLNITAETSVQNMISTDFSFSPLDSVISDIIKTARSKFPGNSFPYSFRKDMGCDIYVNNIDLFLSEDFDQFLNEIASSLDDTQYMLLDFVPRCGNEEAYSSHKKTKTILRNGEAVTASQVLNDDHEGCSSPESYLPVQSFIPDLVDSKAA